MQCIEPALIPLVWPDAIRALAPAIELGGEYTHQAVHDALRDGSMVLWACADAYSVTSWAQFPRGRTAYVKWVAGENTPAWLADANRAWNQWALDMGCTQIRMSGRKGWARLIPDADNDVMLRRMLNRDHT
jgi:hypothetical protein